MKVEIDLGDIWMEDEESLSDALRIAIKNEVLGSIRERIKEQVEIEITAKITDLMTSKMPEIVDGFASDFIESGTIRQHNSSQPEPIKGHLEKIFSNSNQWTNPERTLSRMAEKLGNEMKVQLEGAFAQKIVANMKKQGLLKDEVVSALLADTK